MAFMKGKFTSTDAEPPVKPVTVARVDSDTRLDIARLETEAPTHEDLMKGTKSIVSDLNFKGTWDEMIARMEQAYPQLIDEDLCLTEGGETEWLRRLEGKLGETEEQIRSIIARL